MVPFVGLASRLLDPMLDDEESAHPLSETIFVRKIFWLLLMLMLIVWLGSEPSGISDASANEPTTAWRRTAQGWEKLNLYGPEIVYRRPELHPAIFGTLELALTSASLLLFRSSWCERRFARIDATGN